ncbi:aldehyde dehydrogenase family protein [Nocardia noduli]|uniref:aldehyde dehydrogenase family protein n=1 Tax=Nocardia noduli TaxID=2815722 RepID=UPI0020B45BE7|nr:aldehyde dehydrogenase family protein [Nocardia noduli]
MPSLGMLIDGEIVSGKATFAVDDPSTGEPFAEAPECTVELLDRAMHAAQQSLTSWRLDDDYRRSALRAAARAVQADSERIAALLTAEQGKPLAGARLELRGAASWFNYFADLEVPRQVVQDDARGHAEVIRRPLGVVAAITPWNFPIALASWKIAPALRAGNTIVLKPSPYTPLSTLAFAEALARALPPGVLNVVTGSDPLGAMMVAHPVPRKISFTGSTPTGKAIAASAATDLKRVTLELGGNDPAILLDDVDLVTAAPRLFWGAFDNNGQVCLAIKRVYAPERIYNDVVDALAEYARGVRVGSGTTPDVQLGPICNLPQYERVSALVDDALKYSARAAAGGAPIDRPGYFYAPTILADIEDGVRVVDEEQFGPVLPIVAYRDIDTAIARANNSPYGLTASVWSADTEHALQVGGQLDCGQVSINAHGSGVRPDMPFGGTKSSGIGVENGPWGLDEFTQFQAVTVSARTG